MGAEWISKINSSVLSKFKTCLVGGFNEPFYQPAINGTFAEIRFNRDFERSALHELAHWCVAGEDRRRQQDYGYWYAPEPRTLSQQKDFFSFEVDPQAIEKCFCDALEIDFDVSADNLDGVVDGIMKFRGKVLARSRELLITGLPNRAATVYQFLLEREPRG